MSSQDKSTNLAAVGVEPRYDISQEELAYRRERERLSKDHVGQFAVIHGDQTMAVYPTAEQAIFEAVRRFGSDQVMVREICESDEPVYMPMADINDPSFQRAD